MGAAALPLAVGSMVAGGLLGAYGAEQQGEAANAAAQFNANQARRNVALAQMQMAFQEDQAGATKQAIQRKAAAITGQGRAAYAAGNVKVGSGSELSWERGVAEMAREDVAGVDERTAFQRWQSEHEQQDYLTQAAFDESQGQYALQAGNINAFASLLGAGGRIASMPQFWGNDMPTGYSLNTEGVMG